MQQLQALSNQYRLPLTVNDRLFYQKYKYRVTIEMFSFKYPDLMYVDTVDENAWKVDSTYKVNFVTQVRNYAKKHDDIIRREYKTVNYYTSDLRRLTEIIKYCTRLMVSEKQLLMLHEIKYFPGDTKERNVRYRKKHLPYKKFKFQILGDRMDYVEYKDWMDWAKQYPNDIKLPISKYSKTWGIWAGEPIGYVSTEKMLNLITFKLGSKINKIIEYQVRTQINEK